jgi:glucokinase
MFFVGIDIGGTLAKAAVVDQHGKLCATHQVATPAEDLASLTGALAGIVALFRESYSITAIGIGVAGLRSMKTGRILTSPNIPCLVDADLEHAVGRHTALPVFSENDANAGAYGEWTCGAGHGADNMAYITLGTGLGCGLILSSRLFVGTSGFAGELGHTCVEQGGRLCACGKTGCLETRVSATAIVNTARELGLDVNSAEQVCEFAGAGNVSARQVYEETGKYLGQACANLINLLNPEKIVLGGGVMASGDWLLSPARREAFQRAFAPAAQDCAIVQSELGSNSGTIGAAMLARDRS